MAKPYFEVDLANAINAVRNGASVQGAASEFGIPRTTLRKRLNGAKPHQLAPEDLQRLSNTQEAYLTQWVLKPI